ncbi:tetratricopeptide repeat protein [Streptomyces sp. Je 1-369]|uniref:tetratricopeptide repeat protein n=1 Tax=Streptomyces sp. Je 1-369 TaxID=2966192 RepID=UPI0022865A24|nr:tetratricopeptide repeat protein [Streptomyces sp. Je 1-369]WAL97984.1 tetratricopeptide repeat protein [Streptomyces sp. Je 1-369]
MGPQGATRNLHAHAEALTDEAAATGDRPTLVAALTHLVHSYSFGGESTRTSVPFLRLLRMYDEDPADFGEDDVHRLHWMFKWVVADARQQPDVPLPEVEGWLARMRRGYRTAGYSQRAVHGAEFRLARHVGDAARAARAYAAWTAAARDAMADCLACEYATEGLRQLDLGDDRAALDGWEPVLSGTHGCHREPHETFARSLLPLVRTGRTDQARAHHLRGYRLVRSDEACGPAIGLHVEFCALTGNEPHGLRILAEQDRRWTETGDPLDHLEWLVGAALLMRRAVETGHGERPVPGPPGGTWTAAALLDHARESALDLAARFDRRNGTTAVSDRARARMAAAPLMAELPLGGTRPPSPTPRPHVPVPDPGPDLAPDSSSSPLDRARLCLALAQSLTPSDDGSGPRAERLLTDAAYFAGLPGGSPHVSALARLRLGGLHCEAGRHEEAAAVLESVLPDLKDYIHSADDRTRAHTWLARSYLHTHQPALAAAEFKHAAETARDSPDARHEEASLTQRAAQALSLAGQPAEAARTYERAEDLWRALGEHGALVRALRARAWETLTAHGLAAADTVMTEALDTNRHHAEETEQDPERTELYVELGRTHVQLARLAMEHADGPPLVERGTHEQYAANVRAFERALGHAEQAIETLRACGGPALADLHPTELLAARLVFVLGRHESAATRARGLAAAVRERPDPDGTLAPLAAECDLLAGAGPTRPQPEAVPPRTASPATPGPHAR